MNSKNRSTVLIIEEDQTKTVQMNTKLLRYIKPTVLGLSIATLGLSVALVTTLYKNHTTAQQNAELSAYAVYGRVRSKYSKSAGST